MPETKDYADLKPRELDAKIAEHVMHLVPVEITQDPQGKERWHPGTYSREYLQECDWNYRSAADGYHCRPCAWEKLHKDRYALRNYSTNIDDAWAVVGAMRERKIKVRIFVEEDATLLTMWNGTHYAESRADTAPRAICIAALKATEEA